MNDQKSHQETYAPTAPPDCPPNVTVLGVRVNAVQIPDVVRQMEAWNSRRHTSRYIAVTGTHGVTEAQHDSAFKKNVK